MMVVVPATAAAQPVSSLAEVILNPGDHVRIVGADGLPRSGEVRALSSTALEIEAQGRVMRLSEEDLREVSARDGLRDGVLIGLGVGLTAGIVSTMRSSDTGDNLEGLENMIRFSLGGGIGTLAGLGIDWALRSYRPVYRARSPLVRVSPLIAPRWTYGAVLAFRW
jgi:hypothetical protein